MLLTYRCRQDALQLLLCLRMYVSQEYKKQANIINTYLCNTRNYMTKLTIKTWDQMHP
jgi:hypothetical protein